MFSRFLRPAARGGARFFLCAPLVLAGLADPAAAATLASAGGEAHPGETVATSVSLSAEGRMLSGLQFDIEWDPALTVRAVPGAGIGDSSKLLFQGTPRPGVLRLLIVGRNQVPLADGELVQLFVTAAPNAPPFVARIIVVNPIATTPESAPAPLAAAPIEVKLTAGPATRIVPPSGVLNAASLLPGAVSPGEIVTLFGSVTAARPTAHFNGQSAPILYAGANQINTVVPYELAPDGAATLELVQDSSRALLPIPLAPVSPALFTVDSGGTGQGAILNQDYSYNAESSPAPRGSTVMIFGTGFGTLLRVPAGEATALATTARPVTAAIDGVPAEVSYAGEAPGLIPGLVQINVQIPEALPANTQASLSLHVAGRFTQPGVTISIR